jgi:hypothetical protein
VLTETEKIPVEEPAVKSPTVSAAVLVDWRVPPFTVQFRSGQATGTPCMSRQDATNTWVPVGDMVTVAGLSTIAAS